MQVPLTAPRCCFLLQLLLLVFCFADAFAAFLRFCCFTVASAASLLPFCFAAAFTAFAAAIDDGLAAAFDVAFAVQPQNQLQKQLQSQPQNKLQKQLHKQLQKQQKQQRR